MEVGTRTTPMPLPCTSAHRCTATASSRASCSLGAAPVRRSGFAGRQIALSSRPALPARPRRTLGAPVQAQRGGAPDVADRVVASLPYLVPLFDGKHVQHCAGCRLLSSQLSLPPRSALRRTAAWG